MSGAAQARRPILLSRLRSYLAEPFLRPASQAREPDSPAGLADCAIGARIPNARLPYPGDQACRRQALLAATPPSRPAACLLYLRYKHVSR
jgi:hypothetical protein